MTAIARKPLSVVYQKRQLRALLSLAVDTRRDTALRAQTRATMTPRRHRADAQAGVRKGVGSSHPHDHEECASRDRGPSSLYDLANAEIPRHDAACRENS